MKKMTVRPAPGLKVRDPETMKHLPDDWSDVPRSTYFVRRVKAGDLEEKRAQTAAKSARVRATVTQPENEGA